MTDKCFTPLEEEIKKVVNIEAWEKTSETGGHGIYLFISFDMVNSTLLKIENENDWPAIVIYFYQTTESEIKAKISGSEIWKYLGDEIIFYYNVENINKLYPISDDVYAIQGKIISKMRENFLISKEIDIKITLWLAGISFLKSGPVADYKNILNTEDVYRNIHIKINSKDKVIEDFLGPDIDIGFRISKYSNKSKIVLSAELAYLLYYLEKPRNIDKIDKKLKIVAFEEIKGVWGGRAYPIIWYCPDWENADKLFGYDEYIKNEIIKNISRRKEIEYLEKVFNETGKMDYMNTFIDVCKNYNKEDDGIFEITEA